MQFTNDGANTAAAFSQKKYGSTLGFMVDSNLTPIFSKQTINEEESLSEYKLHSSLDPKLWDKNNNLFEDVRESLLQIAELFNDSLNNILSLIDIRITGSEANYNYNVDSDIDLHLVFDFSELAVDPEFLTDYFNSKKQIFNNQYSFRIKGIPVEVGVEDINTPLVSTGVYSIKNNSWLRIPANAGLEVMSFNLDSYNKIVASIRKIIASQDRERIHKLWKNIKGLRKLSLKLQGEFGEGNLIFKKLRSDGIIKDVKDALNAAISKELSLYQIDDNNDFYFTNVPIYNNGTLTDLKQDNNISIFGDIHSCNMI